MSDLTSVYSYAPPSKTTLSENVLNTPQINDFEYFGTLFGHSFGDNPTMRGFRALSAGTADMEGEKQDVNYLNELYGIDGLIQFDKPITEKRAQYERDVALLRQEREGVLAGGELDHPKNGLAKFATSFTAGMLDPVNLAIIAGSFALVPETGGGSLIPVGQKALGLLSGNILPTAARNALVRKLGAGIVTGAIEGVVEGTAGALISEGAALGLMEGVGVQEKYSASEFGMNIAGGAAFGALLGGGAGFLGKFKKPTITQAAQINGISESQLNDKLTIANQQLVTDKPINTKEIDLIHNLAKKQSEGRANAILEKKALADIPTIENLRNNINSYYGDSPSEPVRDFSNKALDTIQTAKSFDELYSKWDELEAKYADIQNEKLPDTVLDVESIPDIEDYINQAQEKSVAEVTFRNSINEAFDLRLKELADNQDFEIQNQGKIESIKQVKEFLDNSDDYFAAILEDIDPRDGDIEQAISNTLNDIADEYKLDDNQRVTLTTAFQDILEAPATATEIKKILDGDVTTLRTLLKEAEEIKNANIETLRNFDSPTQFDDSPIETDFDESVDTGKFELAQKQAEEMLDPESKAELDQEMKELELEEQAFNEELKVQKEITNCFALNRGAV